MSKEKSTIKDFETAIAELEKIVKDLESGDLALDKSLALFERGVVRPDQIELVVLCTQNPDYKLPTTANLIQARLGLPQSTLAFDINQGCSGYVIGLSTAHALMSAHNFEYGLLLRFHQ